MANLSGESAFVAHITQDGDQPRKKPEAEAEDLTDADAETIKARFGAWGLKYPG